MLSIFFRICRQQISYGLRPFMIMSSKWQGPGFRVYDLWSFMAAPAVIKASHGLPVKDTRVYLAVRVFDIAGLGDL